MESLLMPQEQEVKTNMWIVQQIINGNTIKVSPSWTWENQTGDTIRINGYSLISTALPTDVLNTVAVNRLVSLIQGKTITLTNAIKVEGGVIHCDVYLNGNNIATYFPDFGK